MAHIALCQGFSPFYGKNVYFKLSFFYFPKITKISLIVKQLPSGRFKNNVIKQMEVSGLK